MSQLHVTCLIPAFNEAPRIANVLKAVVDHPMVARTLVIDDGSTDATAAIARRTGATVISTAGNHGKSRALVEGLRTVDRGHVLLLDADLVGLTTQSIGELLGPIASGRCTAAMSLRGNAPWPWRAIGLDYITGERVLPFELLADRLDEIDALPGFGFEVFLNRLLIEAEVPLSIVRWPMVESPTKAKKHGLLHGIAGDFTMLRDIFRTVSVREAFGQIVRLKENCCL